MNKVYLSIGSNLGDKESNIASCIAILGSSIEISNIKTSSFYSTEPLFNTNQPSFLNIILEHETTFSPFQLLDRIQEIEKMLGREEKREKNQPRTIDVDIIIFKNKFIDRRKIVSPAKVLYCLGNSLPKRFPSPAPITNATIPLMLSLFAFHKHSNNNKYN